MSNKEKLEPLRLRNIPKGKIVLCDDLEVKRLTVKYEEANGKYRIFEYVNKDGSPFVLSGAFRVAAHHEDGKVKLKFGEKATIDGLYSDDRALTKRLKLKKGAEILSIGVPARKEAFVIA